MKNKKLGFGIAMVLIGIIVMVLSSSMNRPDIATRLPDGTTVELAYVNFSTNLSYTEVRGPAWAKRLAPIIPDFLEKKILQRGGGISMGSSAEPNLMIAFEFFNANGLSQMDSQLPVRDTAGNRFDGVSHAGRMSTGNNEAASVWILSTVPRRSRYLYLEPSFQRPGIGWTNLGPFEVENPWYGNYPQWTPESLPQSRTNADTVLRLNRLLSGDVTVSERIAKALSNKASPRVTRMEFSFHENGDAVDRHRIYSAQFTDATGNQWRRHTDHLTQNDYGWTTNGVAEVLGALWPGEDAWKIEVQALQTTGFDSSRTWTAPSVSLPDSNSYLELTNQFQFGISTVKLGIIVAPGATITNSWERYVRYYGKEKSVYALGLEVEGKMGEQRLSVVEATDQDGNPIRFVEHAGQDYPKQVLFFQVHDSATELNLTLAFPELKKFEFITRPEFVK